MASVTSITTTPGTPTAVTTAAKSPLSPFDQAKAELRKRQKRSPTPHTWEDFKKTPPELQKVPTPTVPKKQAGAASKPPAEEMQAGAVSKPLSEEGQAGAASKPLSEEMQAGAARDTSNTTTHTSINSVETHTHTLAGRAFIWLEAYYNLGYRLTGLPQAILERYASNLYY